MKNKCVFVIGPESTGSMLVAKICAHVMGIHPYGEWNGVAWSDTGTHKVCHRSLPYGTPPEYPSIEQWVAENASTHELYFILTTRDITISELSRFERWSRPFDQSRAESDTARKIMSEVIDGKHDYLVWSYESFMFLGRGYLDGLYKFLNVESSFCPELIDANRGKVFKPNPVFVAFKRLAKSGKRAKQSLFHYRGPKPT